MINLFPIWPKTTWKFEICILNCDGELLKWCLNQNQQVMLCMVLQVFLLDNQSGPGSVIDYEEEEDRSYIFLIYPPDTHGGDENITRSVQVN